MVKYPEWWIEKWVTLKSGKRFPVLFDYVRKRLESFRGTPIRVVPASEVRERFLKYNFDPPDEFSWASLPTESEIRQIVETLSKFEKLFKGTKFARPFRRARLTFFRYSPGLPLGSYQGFYSYTHNPVFERYYTNLALDTLNPTQQYFLKKGLGLDTRTLYSYFPIDKKLLSDAKLLFSGGRSYIAIGTEAESVGVKFSVRKTLSHEVGHLVFDTQVAKDTAPLVGFKNVYSSYLGRVADEGFEYYSKGYQIEFTKIPQSEFSSFLNDNFRTSLYKKRSSKLLTFYSLRGFDEAFCEAFSYYVLPDKREILKRKWPEAHDYFTQLFPRG